MGAGALSTGSRRPPTSMPTRPQFPFMGPREALARASPEHSTYLGTWETHLGPPPSSGQPQLLAQPDPRAGRIHKLLITGSELGKGQAPQTPSPYRHPKAARTHRLAPSPPPTPQHRSPGMLWEAEAGQCRRATAVAGLKGKCFLNEIKRGLFSRALLVP